MLKDIKKEHQIHSDYVELKSTSYSKMRERESEIQRERKREIERERASGRGRDDGYNIAFLKTGSAVRLRPLFCRLTKDLRQHSHTEYYIVCKKCVSQKKVLCSAVLPLQAISLVAKTVFEFF